MQSGQDKPIVFLSSTFKDEFGAGRRSIPLRTRILEEAHTLPAKLWAYEHIWPTTLDPTKPDADTIIDRCFAGIKACDLFVFILSGAYGTGAALIDERAFSSYLELELFAAEVLKKPILVLHYKGRDPNPALLDVMSTKPAARSQKVIQLSVRSTSLWPTTCRVGAPRQTSKPISQRPGLLSSKANSKPTTPSINPVRCI